MDSFCYILFKKSTIIKITLYSVFSLLFIFLGITTIINGRNKTLYMSSIKSIEEKTRDNLKKKITELGLYNGADILVADVTTPNTLTIKLKFSDNLDVDMGR